MAKLYVQLIKLYKNKDKYLLRVEGKVIAFCAKTKGVSTWYDILKSLAINLFIFK